ncbi:hypothetical protein MMC31_006618 [Peltigera leucophlebia]|nr:hypothetical protein [Peltigera leucophlebia]
MTHEYGQQLRFISILPDTSHQANIYLVIQLRVPLSTRIDIEHAFGMLKGRWKSLTGYGLFLPIINNLNNTWDQEEGWWSEQEQEEHDEDLLLTKLPINNTISRIASMVDEAKLSKPRIQKTADRMAACFMPCIFAVAFVVFSNRIAIRIVVQDLSTSNAIVTAFTYPLCGPDRILFLCNRTCNANGDGAIENATNAAHVVFDKTGTHTHGKFVVVEEVYRGENRNLTASIVKQLTSSSNHPVSQALAMHLKSHGNGSIKLANVSSVVGRGMHATFCGQSVRGGNPLYIGAIEDLDVQRLLSQGLTVFCLRYGSGPNPHSPSFTNFLLSCLPGALAGGAFLAVRIPPAYAGLGEFVSVLPVIAVAIHLQWVKLRWKG